MNNQNGKNTKVYEVVNRIEQMKIFVEERTKGQFVGAVLHLTPKGGKWESDEIKNFEFQLKQFIDTTEIGVYQQCEKWVGDYLNNNRKVEYTIREI